MLQLSRWGLLDEIVAAGTPPVKRTTFTYGDERVVISIKPSHGVDALYAPRRTLLDPVLVHAAIDAGVDVHHRTTVADLITRTRPGRRRSRRHQGRTTVELRAPLVIGADGIRSSVARAVEAAVTRPAHTPAR